MFWRAAWLLLPLLALVELGAHGWIRSQVPPQADHAAAAARVRDGWRSGDAVTIAPSWADPLLRQHLGDLIPNAMAGRSDLDAFGRLWVLSIRGQGAPGTNAWVPDLHESFGAVTLKRYPLPPPSVTFAFTDHVFEAKASHGRDGHARPCPLRRGRPGRGGGLGKAVVVPARRFECRARDRRRFIAPLVLEDLELQPRHCIYQPVHAGGPTRLRFAKVPLADRLVFYGGLYYEDERMRQGAPVTLRVLIDGVERGRFTHHDGDGWARYELATEPRAADVEVQIDARSPRRRGFCWAGSVRDSR